MIEERSVEVTAAIARASELVASELAYVEARAAFARAHRSGRLDPASFALVRSDFDAFWPHIVAVACAPLLQDAADAAERHALRAYDAVHLAAAITTRSDDSVLASFDNDLRAAARDVGLDVLPSG